MKRSLAVLPVVVLALMGCTGRDFRVSGELASEGGTLETWHWRPQGCIRAFQNQEPGAEPVASLLWIDPVRRDSSRANEHQFTVEDAPLRLDLQRVGGQPVAVLETVRTQGTEFNAKNCRRLALDTHEEQPQKRGGRDSLGGALQMDCEVRGQHITAEIEFKGCEY